MADADRLVAALNYLQEQKPADPLESFRSLAGLRDAYERRVQPIINNARQTFSTGGAMGDLLRSYGEAAAPGNAAALQGMGIPFKGPMTAPREEGFSSGENFRPMGDPQQQFAGQLLGDPMNVQPMIAPAARGAVAAGKYAGPELARGLENYMGRTGMQLSAVNTNSLPNSGRDLIRSKADELSNMLNQLGFQTDVKHSGSAAGPSSYVNVYDPQTGRSITDPARISGHSKGAFNSQFVHEISDDPQSMQKFVDLAMEMRAKGPSEMMRQQPVMEQAAIEMRYKNAQKKIAKGKPLTKSEQEAVDLKSAPQDEALRLAQQRAALPVEQHGLGLPADNTPQQRAAAMGAEFGWGHGSNNPDITTFKPSKTGAQGPGIYATNYLPETNMYSSLKDTGNTSYPLAVFKDEALISKLNNPYDELKVAADDELISELFKRNKSAIITNQEPTPDWLLKQGVSEYPERQHYVSVNPDNFRSRFAAFDPWRRNSALAASLGVAAPDLLAQENK